MGGRFRVARIMNVRILLALLILAFAPPAWAEDGSAESIRASRTLDDRAPEAARPLPHRLLAVEAQANRLAVIEAADLALAARLPLRGPLAGPPLASPDGRFAYTIGADGWVERFDLRALRASGRIRVGALASGLALSEDGAWLLAALAQPGQLVALRAPDLELFRVIPGRSERGLPASVGAVRTVPTRASFVALLPEIAEIWELSHDAEAPPVYAGMVHSFEKGLEEAVGETQPFARRRTKAQAALGAFFLSPDGVEIGGGHAKGPGGAVYNLDARRLAARLDADPRLEFAAGRPVSFHTHPAMAFPVAGKAELALLDRHYWRLLGRLPLMAPARHVALAGPDGHLWVSGFFEPHRDTVEIVDPVRRQSVARFRPAPGEPAGPILLAPDGRLAYVLIEGAKGGVVALDAASQKPVKRLELSDPVALIPLFVR